MACAWKKIPFHLFCPDHRYSPFAQTFHGTLSGVIVDSQGAIIANAIVQFTNPSAPGMGYGEPFNPQFAVKLSF